MELREIRTFLAIVKHNNFTKAADELGYAQSTVTSQIKKLESDFGVNLFDRIGKNIYLTESGRRLVPIAKEMSRLETRAMELVGSEESVDGLLRVGTPESVCVKWFPEIYRRLYKHHPGITIDLMTFDNFDYLPLLKNNEVDLVFNIKRGQYAEEMLQLKSWDFNMRLVVAPQNPLAKKVSVQPEDLAGQRYILSEVDCCYHKDLSLYFAAKGIEVEEIMPTNSVQVIKALVMSSKRIGYLPEFAVEDEVLDGRLKLLNWEGTGTPFTTEILVHPDRVLSSRIEAFIKVAKEANFGSSIEMSGS